MATKYVPYTGPIVTRAQAKAAGLKRYFTGKPCPHGHIAQRITNNGSCWPCADARTKALRPEWAARNREKLNAKNREYRRLKPGYNQAYYLKNRDAIRERQRARVAENPEPNRKRAAAWAKANPDAAMRNLRKWQRANPEKMAAQDRKRRARKLNAEGSHTAAEILGLLKLQRGKCVYCNVSLKTGYHADHIVALSRGGTNWISNIQLLCPPCNFSKNASDHIEFAQRSGKLL